MSKSNITSSTGNASVKNQGHTTSGSFGTDPMARRRGVGDARDLKRT